MSVAKKEDLEFLRTIKHRLVGKEQDRLQRVIDDLDYKRMSNARLLSAKRKTDKVERRINTINSSISYYKKRGNDDKVAELVLEREELYKQRSRK